MFCPYENRDVNPLSCESCYLDLCKAFYCLVVGTRTFNDYNLLKSKLDYLLQNHDNVVIVSGDASGADSLAEDYAKEKGYRTKIFRADWELYGRAAGPVRNA